jgi:hypothetical protein
MAKNNNNESEVTIFITDELSDDKKPAIKSLLKIPYKPNKKDFALRIYNGNLLKHFISTRSNLVKNDEGFSYNVSGKENELTGCKFELAEIGTKKIVLSGKIAAKKVDTLGLPSLSSSNGSKGDAEIIDIKKTGTE